MKKTAKKTTKKTVKKVVKPKTYSVAIDVNNQIYVFETDDLNEAIGALGIKMLKTKAIFNIKRSDNKACEKVMMGHLGRMVFRSPLYRRIFIQRLVFK